MTNYPTKHEKEQPQSNYINLICLCLLPRSLSWPKS